MPTTASKNGPGACDVAPQGCSRGGSEGRYEQFVSVFLVSCNPRRVTARARFSVIDAHEQVAIRKCTEIRTFTGKGDGWGFGLLVARLALKQNSSNLLPK
ncbi:hypothetical protein MTO96_040261 [Rhipicephalus appendiculatus]